MSHRTFRAALAATTLLGCVTGIERTATVWEGDLIPSGPGGLTGSIAVVSNASRSEASIMIGNAVTDSVYAWDLRGGACEEAGEILAGPAVYPPLEPDPAGNATADAVLSETLDPGGSYSGRVRYADGTADLACADLTVMD